ncbi:MAG TPA: thiamine phosphate synthase [Bacteroidia bacterium]|jgi:thiamine-phosphate pyrophosphorylase|nr:thiamine phosphate synthase [Bacteroidia bacterium]
MISKLHYITQELPGKSHVQLAEEACASGVDWVQLRVKNKPYTDWKQIALETLAVCKKYKAKLIINDNVSLVKEIGADGVHLGKEDISIAEARKILGNNFIIGGTANTFEDIKVHAAAGVNYIGLGPFRFTSTKEKLSPILGTEGYKSINEKCKSANICIPIIAIGGITVNDISEILETSIYGVAVASVITNAENKLDTIKELIKALNTKSKLFIRQ